MDFHRHLVWSWICHVGWFTRPDFHPSIDLSKVRYHQVTRVNRSADLPSLFPTLRCSRYKTPTSNWQAECFCVPLLLPRWHPGEAHHSVDSVFACHCHVAVTRSLPPICKRTPGRTPISTIQFCSLDRPITICLCKNMVYTRLSQWPGPPGCFLWKAVTS